MKENDGRAARRQLTKKLSVILGSTAALLLVLYAFQDRSGASKSGYGLRNKQQVGAPRQLGAGGEQVGRKVKPKWNKPSSEDWDADKELVDAIVAAKVHLIDLRLDQDELQRALHESSDEREYAGVYGKFCRLDWQVHKQDPSATPMFRDLVAKSPDCAENSRTIDLRKVVRQVRQYDQERQYPPDSQQVPKILNLTATVFHESRCGSTLVANLAVAASPEQHRVYSESAPPIFALKGVCGESYDTCSVQTAAAIYRDVVYLMSRTDDPLERRVFFKIQSVGTRNVATYQEAFPDKPWLFVYRDPVQVMMSHVGPTSGNPKNAVCVRSRRSPGRIIEEILQRHHQSDPYSMSYEDYCAAHLASITETAAEALDEDGAMSIPVNYNSLPETFCTVILPNILGVEIGPAELHRLQATSQQYSKGRGSLAGEFTSDSDQKEKLASKAIRDAAAEYLTPSYEVLEAAAEQAGTNTAVE